MLRARLPRLLVVAGFPPSAPGGGSAVTTQVLKGWPSDCLHWWCPYPQQGRTASRQLSWPPAPFQLFPRKRLRRIRTRLAEMCWAPLAATHLRRTIARFEPEAIWCIPHEWSIPAASAALYRAKAPYAVYLQDYPNTDQLVEVIGLRTAECWMQKVEKLVRGASFVDTTSYPMGADIAQRTGCHSTQMLHEGLEKCDFDRLSQQERHQGSRCFTLAFAGTVVAEAAFAQTISSLEKARRSLTKPLHIVFYSSHSYAHQKWFNPEWMSEGGYKDRENLIDALQSCQAGLVVMNTDESNSNYNKFSFPTKFITYLAAGLETVVVSHESSAVATLVKESGIGLHYCDAGSLADAMPQITRNSAMRRTDRRKIIEFARLHFDAEPKRFQFRNQVLKAAGYP